MNKNQRQVYVALADEVDAGLCAFCKYFYSEVCGEGGCVHALSDRDTFPGFDEYVQPVADCWGFRPRLSVEDCADIVGIILQYGWREWGWVKGKDQIKVFGRNG